MSIQDLVGMADDISALFDSEVGAAEAAKSVASHISRFRDPRMREQIIARAAAGGEGPKSSAPDAVRLLPPPPSRAAARV